MKALDHSEESTEKLRKKLFIYLSTALLALVLGLMTTITFALFDYLEKTQSHHLSHIAELRSIAISEWCRRAKDIARQITSRTRIRQELGKYNKGQISLQQLAQFTKPKLQDAMNLSNEIRGILRLDIKNQIVTQCGDSLPFSSKNITDYISNTVFLSEPFIIKDHPLILVSAPILNRRGERQGTDLLIVDCTNLKAIVTNPEELGKTSEVIVGYRSGRSILPLFSHKSHGKDSPLLSDNLYKMQKFIAKAIKGKAGVVHLEDIALAYHPVKGCHWGVIITQNERELYAPLYKKMKIIGGLSFLIYFIILFGFWFIMKPLAGRILLHTDELEKRIQQKTEILEKEIADHKKTEKEKETVIAELREAMLKIKTLSGMLPICSHCKKIRDDKGYWSQIESYISDRSEAEFSHGICPECAKKLYPDFKLPLE